MTRVLIVDDSPTETHVLRGMLEKHGYDVAVAETGESGIEIARKMVPDVILMDIVMPGVNGFQATRKLSKDPATSAIPIVIISTKDQDTDRIWGMRQGACDYITKPVTEEQLLDAVKGALKN
ncbi:twitching motility two-component system response regulator PilH [Natronocella acetinitrilica]|uniref:Twitching motility two-component system response regulator PilH n=1 Tax=Natronocella acetinitrilica TaxID=414046 RepID=A0AAE3G5K2_9GAMM|nr:response regulator [Natronocella acetinitrilica]MCP1675131.1 twitching motility two-component system response regulator PilH [Natronocella acetinitrilica]